MDYPISSIVVGKRRRKDLGDIDGLATSIADVGLLHPIVVTPEYHLIAGERRLAACKSLGLADVPVTVVDNLDDALALLRAEIDENVERKELLPSEYVPASEELEKLERGAAKERQGRRTDLEHSGKLPKSDSRETIAATVGVSGKTYEKAKAVYEAAEQEPETFGRLLEVMDKSVDKAYRELKQVTKKRTNEETAAAVPPASENYRLIHSPVGELHNHLEANSVDFIITDPPYEHAAIGLYDELGELATYCLKEGGSLIALSGTAYLPELITLLDKHLTYHWIICYRLVGGKGLVREQLIMQAWKPVLWYTNGTYTGGYVYDMVTSEKQDKEHHEWGQSVSGFDALVDGCTQPGDTILDPFLGGGTTAISALRHKRLFIGADNDEKMLVTTRARIGDELADG